jgi:hypothetical protein
MDDNTLYVANEAIFADELRHRIGTGPLAGVFRRGKELVHTPRIGEDGYEAPENGDDDGPAQVVALTPSYRAAMVDARFKVRNLIKDTEESKRTGEAVYKPVPALAPQRAVERVYYNAVMKEDAPNIKNLVGVTHTPVLRKDGTVLSEPGYDPISNLLYLPNNGLEVSEIPDKPGDEDVAQAMKEIEFVIKGFPFVSEDHKANFIGAMFTPLLRPLTPPPYQFVFITAPNPSSGKGFLAEILGELHGRVMRGSFARDSEEFRKNITATLMTTTAPIIQWDNLRGVVKSADFEMLLTSADWSDRYLSRNLIVSAKNDRLWVATGNNAHLSGDLERRTLVVEIDPKMPHPETRVFDINPPRYVKENRGKLLAAMLTVARGWVVAERQVVPDRTDSYDMWRATIRDMLKWAGVEGTFGAEQNQIAVVSEEDEEWGIFLGSIHDIVGDQHFTTEDVAKLLGRDGVDHARDKFGVGEKKGEDNPFDNVNKTDPAIDPTKLPEALMEKFTKLSSDDSPRFKKSLGKALQYKVGRYVQGYKLVLEKRSDKKNPSIWSIEPPKA